MSIFGPLFERVEIEISVNSVYVTILKSPYVSVFFFHSIFWNVVWVVQAVCWNFSSQEALRFYFFEILKDYSMFIFPASCRLLALKTASVE